MDNISLIVFYSAVIGLIIFTLKAIFDNKYSHESTSDIKNLTDEFNQALKFLKQKNLADSPRYLLLGPVGSGKSTLLANNGQHYVLKKSKVIPTRYCDFWVTKQACFLDISGCLSVQDIDDIVSRDLWVCLLKLLRKEQAVNPLQGIIITLAIPSFINKTHEEQSQVLRQIKSRLQDLRRFTRKNTPVTLVFTHMDQLSGFNEFFAEFDIHESQNNWGCYQKEEFANDFPKLYQQLLQRLHNRLIKRLHAERDPLRKAAINQFPLQMEKLSAQLSSCIDYLNDACARQLLGCYFTSSEQHGDTIDQLNSSLSSGFDLVVKTTAISTDVAYNRAYFSKQLFSHLLPRVFQQAKTTKLMPLWLYRSIYASALFVSLSALWYWQNRYQTEVAAIQTASNKLTVYQTLLSEYKPNQTGDAQVMLKPLLALREAEYQLRTTKMAAQAKQTYSIALNQQFHHDITQPNTIKLTNAAQLDAYLLLARDLINEHADDKLLTNRHLHSALAQLSEPTLEHKKLDHYIGKYSEKLRSTVGDWLGRLAELRKKLS